MFESINTYYKSDELVLIKDYLIQMNECIIPVDRSSAPSLKVINYALWSTGDRISDLSLVGINDSLRS